MDLHLLAEVLRRNPHSTFAPSRRVPIEIHAGLEPTPELVERADEAESIRNTADDPENLLAALVILSQFADVATNPDERTTRNSHLVDVARRLTQHDQRVCTRLCELYFAGPSGEPYTMKRLHLHLADIEGVTVTLGGTDLTTGRAGYELSREDAPGASIVPDGPNRFTVFAGAQHESHLQSVAEIVEFVRRAWGIDRTTSASRE